MVPDVVTCNVLAGKWLCRWGCAGRWGFLELGALDASKDEHKVVVLVKVADAELGSVDDLLDERPNLLILVISQELFLVVRPHRLARVLLGVRFVPHTPLCL